MKKTGYLSERIGRIRHELVSREPSSVLTKLTAEEISRLIEANRGVPDDYLQFLQQIGSGRIGECRFMFYAALTEPGDIYDSETASELSDILIVGDDFAGYCLAYSPKEDWRLGWINQSGEYEPIGGNFLDFIEEWFLS
ncbi:MAG: SMI1/KNR4 family protein [Cyanobacteria bacterium]|nr:SMI1/KNR4 family protein [Cyanobacteriota bacterium]